MIDNLVLAQPGGFDQVNRFLIQAVSEALNTTRIKFQADLTTLQDGLAAYISQSAKTKEAADSSND